MQDPRHCDTPARHSRTPEMQRPRSRQGSAAITAPPYARMNGAENTVNFDCVPVRIVQYGPVGF